VEQVLPIRALDHGCVALVNATDRRVAHDHIVELVIEGKAVTVH